MKSVSITIFLCLVGLSMASIPPVPGRKLYSPKGTEQVASLRKVAAPAPMLVIVPSTKQLVWSGNYTQSVAFSVEYRLNPTGKWKVLNLVTNQYTNSITLSNPMCFYRVGAFWP
jgi:hypothetical protein